jgi:hypothetical protein
MSRLTGSDIGTLCSVGVELFVITEGIAEIRIASTSSRWLEFSTINAEK